MESFEITLVLLAIGASFFLGFIAGVSIFRTYDDRQERNHPPLKGTVNVPITQKGAPTLPEIAKKTPDRPEPRQAMGGWWLR